MAKANTVSFRTRSQARYSGPRPRCLVVNRFCLLSVAFGVISRLDDSDIGCNLNWRILNVAFSTSLSPLAKLLRSNESRRLGRMFCLVRTIFVGERECNSRSSAVIRALSMSFSWSSSSMRSAAEGSGSSWTKAQLD